MGTVQFLKIAPHLVNPLVLIGFGLLLFFGMHRRLVKAGLLAPLSQRQSSKVVLLILNHGFLAAILLVVLGFAYASFQTKSAQPPGSQGPSMTIGKIEQKTSGGSAVSGVQGNVTVIDHSQERRSQEGGGHK